MLINAVNYSGLNRLITVTQTGGEKNVRISVTDGGEGISQEELPYVWERYYKSSKNHVRAVTGSGLGLSIVKKIIELHGGMCGVKSEPGAGSTFWFEISL
jgi:signal transduction histidine kinase